MLAADVSGREEATAAALGAAVVPCRVDVTDEEQVAAMFAAARDAFGRVDAVLNVAGIGSGGRFVDFTTEEYDRVMGVDLLGVMLGTKHGIQAMVPTGGGVTPERSAKPVRPIASSKTMGTQRYAMNSRHHSRFLRIDYSLKR